MAEGSSSSGTTGRPTISDTVPLGEGRVTMYANPTCMGSNTMFCAMEDIRVTPPADSPLAKASAPSAAPGAPVAEGAPAAPPEPSYIDITTIVQTAVANLQLPEPEIHFGPEPSDNEWDMLAVGLPIWFWTGDNAPVDASTTQQGITIQLRATPRATTFDLGDGTILTCASSTPRPKSAEPMAKSPTCGHTWLKADTYTVTATTSWDIEWSVFDARGALVMDRSTARTVKVGQLASVVTR